MSPTPHPILVALDDSPRAPAVLRAGDFYSKVTGAPLVLLRVVSPPAPLPAEALLVEPAEIERLQCEEARVAIEKLGKGLVPSVAWDAVVRVGMPWEVICSEAARLSASMTIIGSHGYDALDRILGTTAQKVVNHATRDVLVVRSEAPWTKVVCALDGSPRSAGVFKAARVVADLFDAELELVRGVTIPSLPARAIPRGVRLDELLVHDAKQALSAFAREADEVTRVRTVVELENPRDLVARCAAGRGTLAVIGAHGYGPSERLLGTTAGWFVNHLRCSVLVVRGNGA
ncbi:MAG: universal stress protein [Deltaproteobacteria bacterium]|nr:universal stress protein [Deltaproteobacteria bacterium]